MEVKNKIVWITGASSGIGEQLAYEFAKLKAKVIISSHEKNELSKVKEKCNTLGAECEVIVFDLGKPKEVTDATNKVIKNFKNVDILIVNGGISQRSSVLETPLSLDRKLMEINYFGGISMTKALLPIMIKNGGGHIIATSSISGKFGFYLRSAYSASKHAIHGFYETVRVELGDKNIKVTIVCPGRVQTNISKHALDKDGKEHGKMDEGQATGISPQKCAVQIISAMQKNKKEVLIGGKELLMVHMKRFLPGLFYKIVSKLKAT
ncbi:MAG: SDR family oxidoreductase [Bacteroidota bacterium]|nr:SDR family oxidoreductase [Bacteroidota bacterium]